MEKYIKRIFIGIFVLILIGFLLNQLGDAIRNHQAKESAAQKSSASSVLYKEKFVLKPGGEPLVIQTAGNYLDWELYKVGNEGPAIIMAHIILADGKVLNLGNVSGRWLKESQLPDRRAIRAIKFWIPPNGRTEGLEVVIH